MSSGIDVRKAALIAFVTTAVSFLLPLWDYGQQFIASASSDPKWWYLPLGALGFLILATLPVFYFALYRNQGGLQFASRLRSLALLSAFALAASTAISTLGWLNVMLHRDAGSVLSPQTSAWTMSDTSSILGLIGNAACILLMFTMYGHASDEPDTGVPVSRFLSVICRVTVPAWGVWVGFNLVRLLHTPYTYSQVQDFAAQIGKTPPPFSALFADATRDLFSQAGLFAAPYIVWRAIRPAKSSVGPEEIPPVQLTESGSD